RRRGVGQRPPPETERGQTGHRAAAPQRRRGVGQRAPPQKEKSMGDLPRLNSVIKVLESGGTAFTAFSTIDTETAVAYSTSKYDGIVFEMEHGPYDISGLRNALQYLLNRRQIVDGGSLAPKV